MVVNLVLLVVAVGLSLLAGYLLQKKQKNLTKDDKPTTVATRGAYCLFVLSRTASGNGVCFTPNVVSVSTPLNSSPAVSAFN